MSISRRAVPTVFDSQLTSNPPTIERQYDIYIDQITTRKRNPVTKATLKSYHSYWRQWIHSAIGKMKISEVRNAEMKKLVDQLIEAGLGASYISGVVHVTKAIISSAKDEEGNEMYPMKWNTEFINAPPVVPRQKNPATVPPPSPITPRLLSVRDTAKYLGCALWAVRELCWRGELKYIRIGKRYCIDVRDLDVWIEKRKKSG